MRKFLKTARLFFFVFLLSPVAFGQTVTPSDISEFENWIESSRKEWQIPGVAVGIVKDGKVVYANGFGEKKLGSGEKPDANTIFSIASVSKNITAAALAILVDEGKIGWDDRIIDHIPWFRFKDSWVTGEATIRDALVHRIGLGRILGNRLQFMTKSPRDTILYRMRFMDFEKPFRSSFVYNNVMYSLAGQVIEYADGRTWDQFLKERLFDPLEMRSTTTSITQLKETDNLAYPHQEIDGKVVPIQRRNWDNAGPAGGVNSTINDLNKWMLMQLGKAGEYNGKRLISSRQMNEIHKSHTTRPTGDALGAQAGYGLGWMVTDYKGKRVLTHGGATDGFNTTMYLIPELNLGITAVGNTFNRLGDAIAYQVLDFYLGDRSTDWSERFLNSHREAYKRASAAREKIHDSRIKQTRPSLALDKYIGVYHSPGYGKVEARKQGNNLVLRFWDDDDLEATLEHWHYDTFRAVWKNRAQREEFMQFHLNKQGSVEALDFEFVLRPLLLQVGAYPSNYTHTERFVKE